MRMISYDPHKWTDHLFDLEGSAFREIIGRVAVCAVWSAVVVAVHRYVWPVGIPSLLHSLVGFALGLLLVFRTNSSYDRYWEGRRLWGGIVNSSRNLARAAAVHLAADHELLSRLALWTAVFPYAAMNTLRGVEDLGAIAKELPPETARELVASQHMALHATAQMTAIVGEARRRGHITDIVQVALDRPVAELVDHLGGCERIRKTPLPFAYVVHLRRALILYCFTLPFALVETFGWTTVIDVLVMAYIFFGIEEIGVEIEGPFGFDANDLPLETICATIQTNVYALTHLKPELRPEQLPEGL